MSKTRKASKQKLTEEQVEKLEEKLEAVQADQKNLFLIIFQASHFVLFLSIILLRTHRLILIVAFHHDFVRVSDEGGHERLALRQALVHLDHREAPTSFYGGASLRPYFPSSFLALLNARFFTHFQHHKQVEKYSTTLETLLFTQDLDPMILDVFQQFVALRM